MKKRNRKSAKVNSISWQVDLGLNLFFLLWSAMCIIPFLLVLGISFSSENAILENGYRIIPVEFSTSAYDYVFRKSKMLLNAYAITTGATLFGTVISVLITALYAYPLSRKYFKYRSVFAFVVFFTMIFSGGSVASYMVYTQVLGLKNNVLVYIVPFLMNGWNVILLRTLITSSVPDDLVDAAKIDGAGEPTIFAKVVMPLCKPGLATIALFTTISIWNDWQTASLYVTDAKKHNLQYMLYSMLSSIQYLKTNMDKLGGSSAKLLADMPSEGIRMAMCIVTIGPIVVAYPFFQKYFVKGLTIGAVKG